MMPLTNLFNLFRFHVNMLKFNGTCWLSFVWSKISCQDLHLSGCFAGSQVPPEFWCSCHVFDSMLVLAMVFWLNHNSDPVLALVARESLWIPASMNGTFFMVS